MNRLMQVYQIVNLDKLDYVDDEEGENEDEPLPAENPLN